MFNIKFVSFLLAAPIIIAYGQAHADESLSSIDMKSFFTKTSQVVLECAVQPISFKGEKRVHHNLRSKCDSLVVLQNGTELKMTIGRKTFYVFLRESEFSDGGDLADLVVLNDRSKVIAEKKSVLSFGDILFALGGDQSYVTEVISHK